MSQLNHLLAATDLSAPSRHAVERAARISKETGATLELLYAADLAPLEKLRQLLGEAPENLQLRLVSSARGQIDALAAAMLKRYGVAAGARVAVGNLLTELDREAAATAADLIVCGARGESFVRPLLLGTTAERMLRRAKCPMLVVKQAAHEPYRTLLVAVDFSPSSLAAIRIARLVAPNADLVLLHAFEVPFEGLMRYAGVDTDTIGHYRAMAEQEAIRQMRALVQDAGLATYGARSVVLHGQAPLCIIEEEQNCDLIVMGKKGSTALEALLLGSVTQHVLAESQGDVLVSV